MAKQRNEARPRLSALESIQRRMAGTTEEESLAALRADELEAAAQVATSVSKTRGQAAVFRFDNFAEEPNRRHGSALTRTS